VRVGGLGLSGLIASLVVAVPHVTRRVTGRRVRDLGMICPVCAAGLAEGHAPTARDVANAGCDGARRPVND
jgi:hypothetical protein